MSGLLFKKLNVLLFVFLISDIAVAQNVTNSIDIPLMNDKRIHQQYEGRKRIVPTHIKTQYAGGMGFLSMGIGWDYGSKCCWETDLFAGFIPKAYADQFHYTFTVKQNYIPWSIACNNWFEIEPLTCGLYVNYISGEDFWILEPDRYSSDGAYYGFSTKLRASIYIGQRFVFNISKPSLLKNIALFYELSANEFDIIAKFGNKSLKMSDVVSISLGLKFQIMK